jgi:hypothetical protein
MLKQIMTMEMKWNFFVFTLQCFSVLCLDCVSIDSVMWVERFDVLVPAGALLFCCRII